MIDSKILESLLIEGEEIANEGLDNLIIPTILASAIGLKLHDYKKYKDNEKAKKKEFNKLNRELIEHQNNIAKYHASNQYKQDLLYINKKYGVNWNGDLHSNEAEIIQSKIYDSIFSDLKKMAAKFNSNKKLLKEIANKYIYEMTKNDPDYKEIAIEESKEILYNPAVIRKYDNDIDTGFTVCDCEENLWFMHDYIHKPFCELKLLILSYEIYIVIYGEPLWPKVAGI